MRTLFRSLSIFALLASIVSTAAAEEVRLKAIGAHDTGHFVIKSFLSFIDLVNKEGKGVVVVDGKLVENLHVENAKRLVALAEAIQQLQAA